jgi:hypothetical protein
VRFLRIWSRMNLSAVGATARWLSGTVPFSRASIKTNGLDSAIMISWACRDALEMFRLLRDANLRMLARLTPEEWQRYGIHAERGQIIVERAGEAYGGARRQPHRAAAEFAEAN